MFENVKQRILNKLKPQESSGFTVEGIGRNQMSGWIIPKDGGNPDELNFQLLEKGRDISFSVHFFHRTAFASQNSQNLYGYRIRFNQPVTEISKTSFFYIDNMERTEPRLLPQVAVKFVKPADSAYFLNCMVSQAKLNGEPLPSHEVLKRLISDEVNPSESIEFKMTELMSGELSEFYLQAGLKSKSGEAITGKSGQLFLHGGSNHVDELFLQSDIHREKAPCWLALFEQRQAKALLSGYQYLQIVIPEKQSLLGDLYYRKVSGSSKLLQDIERTNNNSYFSVIEALSKYSAQDLFFRTDSHLNANGTFLLFKEIMVRLGLDINDELEFNRSKHVVGDLGRKYHPITMWEISNTTRDLPKDNRTVEYNFSPPKKTHMGRQIHWVNPHAPIKKKIQIYGNSFAGAGTKQHDLTFWFSHYFEECYFIWAAAFNDELITKFKPDFVIGQSIERFLRLVPRH
jgi:hypothetical protein